MCGCGITAFNSSLTFTGNTIFQENNAGFSSAGAIWASASSLYFTGTNNFIGNAGFVGGAVHVQSNTSLSLTGNNIFYHNSANYAGAIFTKDNAVLTFNGTNKFTGNTAQWYGGAIYARANTSLSFSGTSIFTRNSAYSGGGGGGGGAFYASGNAILTFSGSNNFNSSAGYNGGVIYISGRVVFTLNGINNFVNNSAQDCGGGIYADGRSTTPGNAVVTFNGTNNLTNNSAWYGGVIYAETNTSLSFNGTSTFSYNTAYYGGAIGVYYDNVKLTFNGTNNFVNNSARNGGAIHAKSNGLLRFKGTSNFIHNSADYGGAIFTWPSHNAVFSFNGNNNFFNNSAKHLHGGAILIIRSEFTFNGSNNFTGNSANGNGGAIVSLHTAFLSFIGTSSFCSNSAMQGGAVSVKLNSTVTFNGNISFTNNGQNTRDSCGGAMYLGISSTFSILPCTTVHWENNHANLGGAIYVMNANPLIYCSEIAKYIPKEECFFQLPGQYIDIQLVFKNNSADASGSMLYGGAIDNCKLNSLNSSTSGKVFDLLVQQKSNNRVSSDPFHVYLCENNHPNWDGKSRKELSVYPGETFYVSVVSTGQRNGIVPAQVRSHMDKGRLLNSQYIQRTTKTCTTLNYTVFSLQNVTLELYADGPCSTFGDKLVLKLNINQTCPPGFSLENSSMSCICDQVLRKYTNHCNITYKIGRITREPDDTFWVGYDRSHTLIVHPYCPFDYCINHTVVFPLNNTDMQCANNRSGLLCGACNSTGYSLVLGSSHCKQCTNIHLLLLIPFALIGVALVFLLLVCKLTVATGTLSGLVFYANIVGASHAIFLPAGSTDALSIFIAWLNLDFGIETCFYNGMDASSKTGLQFVFPIYIWMLVGLVILISHYSQRFAKLLGSNPVSVLATLILLSYAKILRTCIAAISPITLQYQHQVNVITWLYDANVDYLAGKHIPLFLVAVLVFLFIFLPYTLLLFFDQWLQAISHLRLFSWVNSARLKPFMDSYHAPYKAKHRYWPGLLLVLRFVLLLVFASNHQQDPNINLLAILLGAGILTVWAWISGGVYKNWCLDALDASFVLNLIVLGVAVYYVKLSGGNKFVAGYTSVAIAFATFIGILTYHIIQKLISTELWKKMPKLKFKFKKLNIKLNKKLNTDHAEDNLNTSTNNIMKSDQLREPLLDDPPQPTHSVV